MSERERERERESEKEREREKEREIERKRERERERECVCVCSEKSLEFRIWGFVRGLGSLRPADVWRFRVQGLGFRLSQTC